MIEIQCTSCHTRYRIDERVLPEETPTFKCSRCGHVFTAEPNWFRTKTDQHSSASAASAEPAAKETNAVPEARESRKQYPSVRPLTAVRPVPQAPSEAQPAPRLVPPQPEQAPSRGESARIDRQLAPAEQSRPVPSAAQSTSGTCEAGAFDPRNQAPATATQLSSVKRAAEPSPAPQEAAADSGGGFEEPRFEDEDKDRVSGENLSFDFDDEGPEIEPGEPSGDELRNDNWEVGSDEPSERPEVRFEQPDGRVTSSTAPPLGETFERRSASRNRSASALLRQQAGGTVDRYLDRGRLHSAGFFIALLFVIAIGFAFTSLMICGAPVASERLLSRLPIIGARLETPPSLESMIALGDVHAHYEQLKGGHHALVVVGRATNGATMPLHVVQIDIHMLDPSSREVATHSVYCGQTLSEQMIAQMTPHEIEFLQKLVPQKTFMLDPSDSAPFVSVFIDLPANVSRYAVSVAKVTQASMETASSQNATP